MPDEVWPGVFSHDTLHWVERVDVAALRGLGLARCGAVCMPPGCAVLRERARCARCFPWPTGGAEMAAPGQVARE